VVRQALIGLALLIDLASALGCHGPPHSVSDGGGEAAAQDAAPDLPPDAAACACQVGADDTPSLSWECYCAQSYVGCDVPLAVPEDCGLWERTDYADCGFTVLTQQTGASAGLPTVYDASGVLIGRLSRSEAALYACPSDPRVFSTMERAGKFPAPTCEGVICDGCYAGTFPCGTSPSR